MGTRGPGETKLEMDRRHIRTRMNEIKHKNNADGEKNIAKDIEIKEIKIRCFK
ncbi:hypothetical protein ACVPOS_10795 [Staphylococcus aureus]